MRKVVAVSAALAILWATLLVGGATANAAPATESADSAHGADPSPQYLLLAGLKKAGKVVGCADVLWAAGQGLLQPVEVRWLDELGVRCPGGGLDPEVAPSTGYVVMVALAAQRALRCADVQWNAAWGVLTWSTAVDLAGRVGGCPLEAYPLLVTLQVSSWLTCDDIAWNRAEGRISGLQAGWLDDASGCLAPLAMSDLLATIGTAASRWGVKLPSLSVEDLRSGRRWSFQGSQQMSFMSSAKLPWAIAAVANGEGPAKVEPYAYAVFRLSDNDAAGSMIDAAGGIDRVNRHWYPTLGMIGSCHQRWNAGAVREYSGNCGFPTNPLFDLAAGHQFFNHNTADDMTTALAKLWRGQVAGVGDAGRSRLLEWSTWPVAAWAPDGDGTITGHLPAWTWPSVHHKIGWFFDPFLSASDVGIIDLPESTYALAVAAYGGSSSAAQADFLAWASCQVYRAMTGDRAWTCPALRDPQARPGRLALDVRWAPAGGGSTKALASGSTTRVATSASAVAVTVTVGPTGLRGDRVVLSSTTAACEATLPITSATRSLQLGCQVAVPAAGDPANAAPVAQRWTATVLAGDTVVASNSTAALIVRATPALAAADSTEPTESTDSLPVVADVANQLDGHPAR